MSIVQAAVISLALSLDAFAASFAYGSNRIKVPMRSVQTINLICAAITGLSLFVGSIVKQYIPEWLTVTISFTILFILGLVKLFDSVTKSLIRKNRYINREIKFSMFNFIFILRLYADPESADVDSSKVLSPGEAASLAVALSLDGIAVGFGAALSGISPWAIFISSLVTGMAAIYLGVFLGNKIASKVQMNLSWLGGVILIVMAILKLV